MENTRCKVCHRPLSKDESVKRGMGPGCFAKQVKINGGDEV